MGSREKIVMASSPERYVVVDESKLVERLGTNFAVPIEVLPEAVRLVRHALANLGVGDLSVRPGGTKDGPFPTHYEPLESPSENLLHPAVNSNPAARVFADDRANLGIPAEFPYTRNPTIQVVRYRTDASVKINRGWRP